MSILFALLTIGQLAPWITLADETGQTHALPRAGQPLLLAYDDRESTKQNVEGKKLLAAWHDPLDNRGKLDVWPVADLSSWDFWPARGPALKAVRASADKERTHVLVDWKGAGVRSCGFRRGHSAMLLVGADGRVLFASEGEMTLPVRESLEAALRALGLHAP